MSNELKNKIPTKNVVTYHFANCKNRIRHVCINCHVPTSSHYINSNICCLSVAFACLKKASWVSFLRWILAVAILKILISNDHYSNK